LLDLRLICADRSYKLLLTVAGRVKAREPSHHAAQTRKNRGGFELLRVRTQDI
jgi:hypothetical protein